ncbi:MAG: OmpA family protein [Verrucomicrobiae bacterium]|nr:OmpA family protein [Verrucomicrobiae bacterium]
MNTNRLLPLLAFAASLPLAAGAQQVLPVRDTPLLKFGASAPKPSQPLRSEASRMISVLRGQGESSKGSASDSTASKSATLAGSKPVSSLSVPAKKPASKPAPVVERRSKIAPEALPQGLAANATPTLKRGRVPADGVTVHESDEPTSKIAFMKKGNTPAEGHAPPSHPHSVESKAGRIVPEGRPVPPRPQVPGGSPLLLSSEGGASGGYPAGPYPAEISYRVDASSQLSTNTVKFVKGGIELADRASYEYLFSLSEALSSPELAGDRFVVEGHASAEGSDYANLILSQRRANAIFEFLASRGVDPGRLLAVGHGESQARFGDHEPEFLRAQDRQVIVFKLAD